MYYLDQEPKRSPVRKFIIFALVLTGAYFGLKTWSPKTLDRVMFWKKTDKAIVGPGPEVRIEPAPQAKQQQPGTAQPAATPSEQPRSTAPVVVDKNAQVAVLLYHRLEAKSSPALRILPAVFEEHMQKLKDSGITVISMQDFLAWKRGEKSIPARSALITIDDGYMSTYDVARPILKKFGYPWTCFVYTNFISRGSAVTWEQLAEMRDEGIEIGCHSASHANLRDTGGKPPEVYDEWLKQEIVGAKQLLEQRLGIRCATYAYPYGSYSARVLEYIRTAGYEAAFTLGSSRASFAGPSDRVPRYSWLETQPLEFNAIFSWSGRVQSTDAAQPSAPANSTAPSTPTTNSLSSLLTQPMDGEIIREPQPQIRANLSTLGKFEPDSVTLRLSGLGPIPYAWVDGTKTTISARLPKPLEPGEYTVTVTAIAGGKRTETQWKFRFDPTGGYDNALAPLK